MMKKFIMFSILALFGIICGCWAKQDDSDLQCSDGPECEIKIDENVDENIELPPIAEDNDWEDGGVQDSEATEV